MKAKTLITLVIVSAIILTGVVIARLFANGGEDIWICEGNRWVKHGNPAGPSPSIICGTNQPTQTVLLNTEPTEIQENTNEATDSASTNAGIADAFSRKYKRPADAFTIKIESNTGSFAKGSVRFKNELDGGIWFAAKTANGWELAFDGNGIMSCEAADRYDFPKTMVPACIDIPNGNAYVER